MNGRIEFVLPCPGCGLPLPMAGTVALGAVVSYAVDPFNPVPSIGATVRLDDDSSREAHAAECPVLVAAVARARELTIVNEGEP